MRSLLRLDAQRLLLLVFLGAIFSITAAPLVDTDLWWHLADGRYILAHGVPSADVYSFTAAGQPWVVHEWLTEIGMYLLYLAGGIRVLVLVAAGLTAGAMFAVYRLLRGAGLGNNAAIVVGVLLALAASPSWGARPQLVTFLLTAVLLCLLFRYRRSPGRWLFWLIPGFVLWANLHPGFLFGAAMMVAFLVGEWLRGRFNLAGQSRTLGGTARVRLGLVALAAALSGLATPATVGTYAAFVKVVASPAQRQNIAEWQSPDFHLFPSGFALLVVLMLLVVGALALAGRRDRDRNPGEVFAAPQAPPAPAPDLTESILGLGSLFFALNAQRNVALFAVAGAPLLGRVTAGLLAALGIRARRLRPVGVAAGAVNWLLLALLAVLVSILRVGPNLATASIDRAVAAGFPVAATDRLIAGSVPAPTLNAFEWGGYLVWRTWPERRVFIDGRVEVYGDGVLRDYTEAVSTSATLRQQVLDRYGIQSILIPAGTSLGADLRARGWGLEYADPVAEIYTRPHA